MELSTLNLVDIALDLQITICIFLHPFDILAVRKVCHQSTLNLLVAQVTGQHLRLVKLLSLLHGNEQCGLLLFIEYASTTPFSLQVSPYPI
jgi:hypothetical protein